MAIVYKVLTEDEQDDIMINTLLAQERDHFCYNKNVERYTELVKSLPDNNFKKRIEDLLVTEQIAVDSTEATLLAIEKQLPDKTRIDAALLRIKGK